MGFCPRRSIFTLLKEKLGSPLPLIAEDLGIITDEVAALRDFAGLPGMRILQFAFGQGKNNPYLPHCYDKNTVVYTGTHDNDTTNGWYQAATEQEKDHYRRYLNVDGSNAAWDFIRLALSSPADTAILPLQDVLSLWHRAPHEYSRHNKGQLGLHLLLRLVAGGLFRRTALSFRPFRQK